MSFPKDDIELDAALSEAFTPPPAADFKPGNGSTPMQLRVLIHSGSPL